MASPSHLECSKKELERKDCLLRLSSYKVQISKLKVTWSDGSWTAIADLPMVQEDFHWQEAKLAKMGTRWVLQIWIWDAGKGEAKVESLHWLVSELKDRAFFPKLDKVVRKREVRATPPGSYSYDREVPHGLKPAKGGLRWTAGRDSGVI